MIVGPFSGRSSPRSNGRSLSPGWRDSNMGGASHCSIDELDEDGIFNEATTRHANMSSRLSVISPGEPPKCDTVHGVTTNMEATLPIETPGTPPPWDTDKKADHSAIPDAMKLPPGLGGEQPRRANFTDQSPGGSFTVELTDEVRAITEAEQLERELLTMIQLEQQQPLPPDMDWEGLEESCLSAEGVSSSDDEGRATPEAGWLARLGSVLDDKLGSQEATSAKRWVMRLMRPSRTDADSSPDGSPACDRDSPPTKEVFSRETHQLGQHGYLLQGKIGPDMEVRPSPAMKDNPICKKEPVFPCALTASPEADRSEGDRTVLRVDSESFHEPDPMNPSPKRETGEHMGLQSHSTGAGEGATKEAGAKPRAAEVQDRRALLFGNTISVEPWEDEWHDDSATQEISPTRASQEISPTRVFDDCIDEAEEHPGSTEVEWLPTKGCVVQ